MCKKLPRYVLISQNMAHWRIFPKIAKLVELTLVKNNSPRFCPENNKKFPEKYTPTIVVLKNLKIIKLRLL
jgi:hypothetical protein